MGDETISLYLTTFCMFAAAKLDSSTRRTLSLVIIRQLATDPRRDGFSVCSSLSIFERFN